jgi:hypothetical protein
MPTKLIFERVMSEMEIAFWKAVDRLRKGYQLELATGPMVEGIKATMSTRLPSGYRVIDQLCERYRQKMAAFGLIRLLGERFIEEVEDQIQKFDSRTPRRRARQIARNTLKLDPAAHRRIKDAKAAGRSDFSQLYKGRPERHDSAVVLAFADTIKQLLDRQRFPHERQRNEDSEAVVTITRENMGPALGTLVAAVEWAEWLAWSGASSRLADTQEAQRSTQRRRKRKIEKPGAVIAAPPPARPETLLAIVRRAERAQDPG